jgi:hypothetical protein
MLIIVTNDILSLDKYLSHLLSLCKFQENQNVISPFLKQAAPHSGPPWESNEPMGQNGILWIKVRTFCELLDLCTKERKLVKHKKQLTNSVIYGRCFFYSLRRCQLCRRIDDYFHGLIKFSLDYPEIFLLI